MGRLISHGGVRINPRSPKKLDCSLRWLQWHEVFIGFVNMAPLDYRSVVLRVGGYRVKQLTVVGVAAESFWKKAFHERRGLSSLGWADVASVTLLDATRVDSAGREKRMESVEVALTRVDSELALRGSVPTPSSPVDSSKRMGSSGPGGGHNIQKQCMPVPGSNYPASW